MIPPHELKNKTFTVGFRGYNTAEVDEHIEFIIEKYTELYKANIDLEKQLSDANERLSQLSNEEEAIRNTLVKAQKMGEAIIKQSKEEADGVIMQIRERSESIIAETEKKLEEEKKAMAELREGAAEFRDKLLKTYRDQLDFIKQTEDNEAAREMSAPAGKELRRRLLNVDKAKRQSGDDVTPPEITAENPENNQ